MKKDESTNWCQSVTGIVFKNNQVLLVRHTYGTGEGKLIIPGGYVKWNETPQEAVKREIYEETNVIVEPDNIVGIRFSYHDWYIAFIAKYISGEPVSDDNENNEAIWMDINEVFNRDDVPDLTKKLIKCALSDVSFYEIPYQGNINHGPYSLYGVIDVENPT
jgi:ADP-ribose pyrophosphatase YjhB (NUDIX family)